MQILTENLDKLDELEAAVRGELNDGILPYLESTFSEGDEKLHALSVWFKTELARFYSSRKSRINRQLRDYLDRIERIDKPSRKVEQIFRLWSNNQLENFSNVIDCLNSDRARIQKPRDLKLSIDLDLQTDDNKNIELVVREFNLEDGATLRVANGIKRSDIGKRVPPAPPYNLLNEVRKLFSDYCKSGGSQLLVDYVFSYQNYSRNHSFKEKIGLFLEVVNQYRQKLVSDNQYTVISDGDYAYKCKNIKLKAS